MLYEQINERNLSSEATRYDWTITYFFFYFFKHERKFPTLSRPMFSKAQFILIQTSYEKDKRFSKNMMNKVIIFYKDDLKKSPFPGIKMD